MMLLVMILTLILSSTLTIQPASTMLALADTKTDLDSKTSGNPDDDSNGGGMFENFVEGYVKNLFTKELDSAETQNQTDCWTRLLCENICQRTANGQIKEQPMVGTAEMFGGSEKDPLGYFFSGGDRGYEFGRLNQCQQCQQRYPQCDSHQYHQTKTISDQYEKTMLDKPAKSSSVANQNEDDFYSDI